MKTKEEKANEYSDNILLSDFFKVNHEKDFLAGYDQALRDSKAPEMLEKHLSEIEILKNVIGNLPFELQHLKNTLKELIKEKKQLIKEATEL